MENCVFCSIARHQQPARIVKEDDRTVAFRDTNPQARIHILVIPREHIPSLEAAQPQHSDLLGHLLLFAQAVARDEGIVAGYRIVINNGAGAGQTVHHLHVHVLGGRPLGWPPG